MQDRLLFANRAVPLQANGRPHRPAQPALAASPRRFGHYLSRSMLHLAPLSFGTVVIGALIAGWLHRDEELLTAESGLGYWLGIVGASMMLLLMLYPLRKRIRLLRFIGSVPGWFRIHMVLGILGPSLILFHTNFRLGSLNSNVALATMLIVVASGIAGRYLYAKVHKGLYGSASAVRDILADSESLKQSLGEDVEGAAPLVARLHRFEQVLLARRRGLLSSIRHFLTIGLRIGLEKQGIMSLADKLVTEKSKGEAWSWRQRRAHAKAARGLIHLYFAAVRKAARFAVYERLLAMWHVLHLPLFLLLVLATVIHVIAVHQY